MEHYIDKAIRLSGIEYGKVVVPVCLAAPNNTDVPVPVEATFDGFLSTEPGIVASFTDPSKEGRFYRIPYPATEYGKFASDKGRVLVWKLCRLSDVADWIWAQPPGFEWKRLNPSDGNYGLVGVDQRRQCLYNIATGRENDIPDPWVWALNVYPKT